MIKIKLECWWTDSHSINTRMIKQFVSNEDLTQYSLVTENPDFTIVFGRTDWDNIETPKEKTFYISQEPLWSPNQPKDGIHDYCSKILISDKLEYPDREEYIETHLFDHENVLDWCINLFFGPQKKYQTSYSKKLFKKNLIVELEQNMIVEEWLVRDELTLVHQLGLDPVTKAKEMARKDAEKGHIFPIAGDIERGIGQLPPPTI